MITLKNGKFYWIEDKQYKKVYMAQYDMDWGDGGCFDLIGNDGVFSITDFEVLGEVEIPDFIEKRLNEQD